MFQEGRCHFLEVGNGSACGNKYVGSLSAGVEATSNRLRKGAEDTEALVGGGELGEEGVVLEFDVSEELQPVAPAASLLGVGRGGDAAVCCLSGTSEQIQDSILGGRG